MGNNRRALTLDSSASLILFSFQSKHSSSSTLHRFTAQSIAAAAEQAEELDNEPFVKPDLRFRGKSDEDVLMDLLVWNLPLKIWTSNRAEIAASISRYHYPPDNPRGEVFTVTLTPHIGEITTIEYEITSPVNMTPIIMTEHFVVIETGDRLVRFVITFGPVVDVDSREYQTPPSDYCWYVK